MAASPVIPARVVPPNTLQWLALTLTEGLGPTRSKRLVEDFGDVAGIFRASLTELEAAGLRASSAQSIFTGKSVDLAQQEMVKAADSKADVVTLDDPRYPQRLKEIYDPPLVVRARISRTPFFTGDCNCRHSVSNSLWRRHGGATGVRFVEPGAEHSQRVGKGR